MKKFRDWQCYEQAIIFFLEIDFGGNLEENFLLPYNKEKFNFYT